MTKRVLVPLAEGFEEMEAVIIIDVLRRADLDVIVAGLDGVGPVLGSRGVTVIAEAALDEVLEARYDAIVLPGGLGGTERLREHEPLLAALVAHAAGGELTAAVCAGPLVLARAGLVEGRLITAHPGAQDELVASGARFDQGRVVRDGVLLTSQGPGTAMEFALAVVEHLVGGRTVRELRSAMCLETV